MWIEPADSLLIESEMEYLRKKCGGSEAGQYSFVPHCTLLYNTKFHDDDADCADGDDGSCCDDDLSKQRRQGEAMLRQCLEEYQKQIAAADTTTFTNDGQQTSQTTSQTNNIGKQLQLIPTSQYYFPYPKTADNGTGFGCCISLLILETTPQLKLLHDIVRKRFPPDERHGDDDNNNDEEEEDDDDCNDNNNKEDEEGGAEEEEEARFRPHMALVYAPEDQENVTNGFLKEYTEQSDEEKRYETWILPKEQNPDQTLDYERGKDGLSRVGWNARILSIWSTEGTLDEWYPICKLNLDTATII